MQPFGCYINRGLLIRRVQRWTVQRKRDEFPVKSSRQDRRREQRDDFTVKSSRPKIGSEATVSGKIRSRSRSARLRPLSRTGPLDVVEAPTVRCGKDQLRWECVINSGSGHHHATAQPPAPVGRDFGAACACLARRSHDPARRMRDPPACRPDRRAAMHQGVQRRRHPPGDQRVRAIVEDLSLSR